MNFTTFTGVHQSSQPNFAASKILYQWFLRNFLSFFFFFCFLGLYPRDREISRLGIKLELQLPAVPQPQQCGIWATSATYTTAHGNAGSLTHRARAGIEPATSWFLVGFVNHWATIETPYFLFFFFFTLSSIMFHHKWSVIVPCAIQQDLIAYPLQSNSLCLLTPNFQSFPLPSWQPQVCFPCPWVCFFSVDRFVCAIC